VANSVKRKVYIHDLLFFSVKPEELKRIEEAFQRFSSKGGLLPKVTFLHDVLDQTVPLKLAEVRIYNVLI